MSYLDKFCISHSEERNKFIGMTEKGLQLDKADFNVNSYKVDEDQYPRNLDKAASLSGKGKMKADEVMVDVPSNKDTEEENVVALGDDVATFEPDAQESSDKEEEEVNSKENAIPLVRVLLGRMTAEEEDSEELVRMRGQATSQKLYDLLNPPSPSPLQQESRPTQSSPLLAPNLLKSWREKHPVDNDDKHRQRVLEEIDAAMYIALQSSMSKSQDPPPEYVNLMMLNMLHTMQKNQEASN
jgi:hypothetical protein